MLEGIHAALNHAAYVCVCDGEGVLAFANDKFLLASGYLKDEIVGKPLLTLDLRDQGGDFFATVAKVISEGKVWRGEILHKSKTGFPFWVETTIVSSPGDASLAGKHIWIGFDVTERKGTEQYLADSQIFSKALMQSAPTGLFLTNAGGGCTYVNEKWIEFTGLKSSQAMSHGWKKSIHPEDARSVLARWEGFLSGAAPFQCQYRYKRADGKETLVLASAVPLVGSSGKVSGYLRTEQDITELKQAEVLRSERDAAEEANQAKSAFLANMSHEIRTPMHGILSYARFGQQKIDSAPKEKLKTYFDEIHDSGSRLMKLLNDILDLSKLEAGKVEYVMEEGDLAEVVQAVGTELSALMEEMGLKLAVEGVPHPTCVFDKDKIMQVLRNLLSNAIKFSDKGSLVRVELGRSANGITCSVVNRGVGIPASELESVFDKFVQSTKTRTGAGGTGLGLAICKEILAQHRGRIWAQSQPGGETTFTLELPA
jgi:PAS domain S-box-containing protein